MSEGYNEVIAPGAFKSQVGKVVPVTAYPGGPVIGSATVKDEDGNVEITLPALSSHTPESNLSESPTATTADLSAAIEVLRTYLGQKSKQYDDFIIPGRHEPRSQPGLLDLLGQRRAVLQALSSPDRTAGRGRVTVNRSIAGSVMAVLPDALTFDHDAGRLTVDPRKKET